MTAFVAFVLPGGLQPSTPCVSARTTHRAHASATPLSRQRMHGQCVPRLRCLIHGLCGHRGER